MYKTLDLSQNIRMIVSDFDGIFTDNSVYFFDFDNKVKKLSFKDLMGVSVATKNGIIVGIISGEKSKEIDYIAEKFGLTDIHQGIRQKLPVLEEIKNKYGFKDDEIVYIGFKDDEIVYIGDDINDIDCLNSVKYAVTVNQANYRVKQEVKHIQFTKANAGDGAFREVVDNIVELKNHG